MVQLRVRNAAKTSRKALAKLQSYLRRFNCPVTTKPLLKWRLGDYTGIFRKRTPYSFRLSIPFPSKERFKCLRVPLPNSQLRPVVQSLASIPSRPTTRLGLNIPTHSIFWIALRPAIHPSQTPKCRASWVPNKSGKPFFNLRVGQIRGGSES